MDSSEICVATYSFRLARYTVFSADAFSPLTVLIKGVFHDFKLCFLSSWCQIFSTFIAPTLVLLTTLLPTTGPPGLSPSFSLSQCCFCLPCRQSVFHSTPQSQLLAVRLQLHCQAAPTEVPKGTSSKVLLTLYSDILTILSYLRNSSCCSTASMPY